MYVHMCMPVYVYVYVCMKCLCVCVSEFTCMYVFVWVHANTHVCICIQKSVEALYSITLPYFLETGSLPEPEPGWQTARRGIFVSLLLKACVVTTGFVQGIEHLESGRHV